MINKIRKRLPRYYNEDVQYFISNSKYKIGYEVIVFITGFIITWLFANFTSSEFYGTYLFIGSVSSFFSFLSFGGILTSINQSVANGYDHFFITGMKKTFFYSILGSISIFTFSIFYFLFLKPNSTILIILLIVSLSFPFMSSLVAFHNFLDGKFQFRKDFYYKFIQLIVQDSLILILIFITTDLISYFLILNVLSLILNLIFTKSCVDSIEVRSKIIEKEKKALNYGFFLTKISLLSVISVNINSLIIGIIFSPITLSFYTVGIGLPNKMISLIKPSFSVLFSKFSKKESKLEKKFLIFIIIGSIGLYIMIILFLPLFLSILFPNYINSISYGIIYASIILIEPITTVFGYYFKGKVDKKTIRQSEVYSNILKLSFLVPFTLLFQVFGIILSEIIRWITLLIIFLIAFKREK